jgi:hypothetical protein
VKIVLLVGGKEEEYEIMGEQARDTIAKDD